MVLAFTKMYILELYTPIAEMYFSWLGIAPTMGIIIVIRANQYRKVFPRNLYLEQIYAPQEVSAHAYEVARAYDRAELKDRNTARLALNLELIKEDN